MADEKRKPAAGAIATGFTNDLTGKKDQDRKSTLRKQSPQAKWAAKNPLATWAHSALRSAERRGLITRPDKCDACGKVGPVDAHHDPQRYDEPLRVDGWFCRACHKAEHRRIRRKATAG